MAKTLKDLALALLNATLILVALCLFFGLEAGIESRKRLGRVLRDRTSSCPYSG